MKKGKSKRRKAVTFQVSRHDRRFLKIIAKSYGGLNWGRYAAHFFTQAIHAEIDAHLIGDQYAPHQESETHADIRYRLTRKELRRLDT